MRHVVLFAVLALVVAGLVPRFYPNVTGATAAANKTGPVDPFPDQSNSRSMTISRGDNGHFQVEATIDGRRMAKAEIDAALQEAIASGRASPGDKPLAISWMVD